MQPTIAELMAALPEAPEHEDDASQGELLHLLTEKLSKRPVPVSSLKRFSLLGSLQAKVAVAYFFYWLRSWFGNKEDQKKQLSETHLRAAVQILDSMSYLRGAVMKIGQTLANFPDLVPQELAETLGTLHFEAPPMHYSLIREQLHDELGGDPEDIFAEFDQQAFAAASLGQVHRARLKNGEEVAVKIQYPGIARTIRADFRNLEPLLLPARFTRDWDSTRAQIDYVRRTLERETDYEYEARTLEKARALFHEEDGIVVPRVFSEHSTRRVLTMERLPGCHLKEFLKRNPPQELRDHFGEKLMRAWFRLLYAGRMCYVDWHAGNFLFMNDGKLGLLDFGCLQEYTDEDWELMRIGDRGLTTGSREDRLDFVKRWNSLGDTDRGEDFWRLVDEYTEWAFASRTQEVYDYGDAEQFLRGARLFGEFMRKRYTSGHPSSPEIGRWEFSCRGILLQLRARVRVQDIAEEEIVATGWPRDYARSG